jgi:hypothetical protein
LKLVEAPAVKVPGPRLTIRSLMAVVGVVAVVTFVLIGFLPDEDWVGHTSVPLEFLILDSSTGQPIERATIRLVETKPEYQATTGRDGRAKIVLQAPTAGRSSLLRSTRTVNYAWMLLVTADRHQEVREDLGELTRSPRYHSDSAPPPIVIRLAPVPWRL